MTLWELRQAIEQNFTVNELLALLAIGVGAVLFINISNRGRW